jgi:hypothetical protein
MPIRFNVRQALSDEHTECPLCVIGEMNGGLRRLAHFTVDRQQHIKFDE